MARSSKTIAEQQFTASTKMREQFHKDREQERQLKAQHTAKLRALRLEKEEADRKAAELADAAKKAGKGKKRSRMPQAHRPEV